MKVLFAVSSESISDAIIKRYQKEYKEILSYKNVYYFNAILKEIQNDKTYDRIVISEDLEPFSNKNYDTIDKFIFEKLDNISDEAQDSQGKETSIILICTDRRTKGSSFLVKLFGIGVYNAILGNDRSMDKVCELINRPRVKKEAKMYYKIDSDDVSYAPKSEKEVSELEIQNILNHFKKISKNKDKYSDSFNNIAAQYTDEQLKIIVNCLPISVKAVLEEECPRYQELMSVSGMIQRVGGKASLQAKEDEQKTGIKIDVLENRMSQSKMSGPIVIPSSVRMSGNKGPNKVKRVVSTPNIDEPNTEKNVKRIVRNSASQIQKEDKKENTLLTDFDDLEDDKLITKPARPEKNVKQEKKDLSSVLDDEDDDALLMSFEDEKTDDSLLMSFEDEKTDDSLLMNFEDEIETVTPTNSEEDTDSFLLNFEDEEESEEVTKADSEEDEDSFLMDFEDEEESEEVTKADSEEDEDLFLMDFEDEEEPEEIATDSETDEDSFLMDFEDEDEPEEITADLEEVEEPLLMNFEDKEESEKITKSDSEEDADSLLMSLNNESEENNNDSDLEVNPNKTITIKRGRGRPRKNPVDVAPKPKGKRGRPRKNPIPVEPEIENNIEDESLELVLDDDIKEEKITPASFLNEEDSIPIISDEFIEEDNIEESEELEDDTLEILTEDDTFDGNEEDEESFLMDFEDDESEEIIEADSEEDEDSFLMDFEDEEPEEIIETDSEEDEDSFLLDFEDDDTEEYPSIEEVDEDEFEVLDENEEELSDEISLSDIDDLDDIEDYESEESDDILTGMDYEDIQENDYLISNNSNEESDDDNLLLNFDDEIEEPSKISNDFSDNIENNEPILNQNYNNYKQETNSIESIKPQIDYSMSTLNSLLTKDKKIVTFIGTTKNGTSFLINNLAALFSSLGINTAILDMTQNRNSYYIYTKNEEELRKIAYTSIEKLENGFAEGIKVDKNLTVYTALPNNGKKYTNAEPILSTLVQNHSLILIDCDFDTDPSYFASCQEIYLVQSMDILTIQPLTSFLRDLKAKGVLESEKVRVIINKETKVRSLTTKIIIGGMSFYNDPAMSFMTELFNKDMVKACSIPFEDITYSKYLDAMVNCNVSLNGYPKAFLSKLRILGDMVYPLTSRQTYSKPTQNYNKNAFSNSMNSTLNQMKNKF